MTANTIRTRQMKGKRSAAEEGRKLFNPLREAHAKLEVIIHSDDATIHFVGRVAFVSKEEASLVNVIGFASISFACSRTFPPLNSLRRSRLISPSAPLTRFLLFGSTPAPCWSSAGRQP